MSAPEQGGPEAAATSPAEKPFFEIVRGNPGPVEIGVLAALFATAQGNATHSAQDSGPRDDWGSREDRLRAPFGYNPSSYRNARLY